MSTRQQAEDGSSLDSQEVSCRRLAASQYLLRGIVQVIRASDAGDVGGEEVDGASVEVAAGAVLVLGGPRERTIRMAVDLRRDPGSRSGALRRVDEQLRLNPE